MTEATTPREAYPPIGAYAVIGDCHSAALVSQAGSIDWYCPARFDAAAVFCRLLDADKGGFLSIEPVGGRHGSRRYRGATNVLETIFMTDGGQVRLTDFMPIHRYPRTQSHDADPSCRIVRLVEAVAGDSDVMLHFKPTFDYARAVTEIQVAPDKGAVAQANSRYLTLACPNITLQPDGAGGLQGRLSLRAGERYWVVVTHTNDAGQAREALAPVDGVAALRHTIRYWEQWAERCTYQGPYRAAVLRSALTLKIPTYAPTGAVVAAPTTSLPEQLGGQRNWDYRYTWLRDSSLILYALQTVGYRVSAMHFFRWLERTQHADTSALPQIMYGIHGEQDLPEITLDGLAGYQQSRPVRVGNAAAQQHQLDIYGEVLNSADLSFAGSSALVSPSDGSLPHATNSSSADDATRAKHVQRGKRPSRKTWSLLSRLVEIAVEHWQEPDNGIWEVRGGPQRFLYSAVQCWTAVDRGIRLASAYQLPAPLTRWNSTRAAIRDAILTRGFDAKVGAFTQALGSTTLDASALVIPRVGFLPATDARVQSTVECIHRELTENGLVYRYRTADGLEGSEGTFVLCSFWLVDALALGGRLDAAHELFERVLGYANDVGLLSEEIDSTRGTLLGNFPQGFSHLALISSAVNLAKAVRHGAEEQAQTEAERMGIASRAASAGYLYPAATPVNASGHADATTLS